MVTYLIRRVVGMIPTLIIISMLVFFIIELPPGDFLTLRMSQMLIERSQIEESEILRLEARYGLGRPIYVRYWLWISKFVRGDMGESLAFNLPVAHLIGQRIMLTSILSLSTMIFTMVLAVPIGIFSAVRQYSIFDQIFTFLGFLGLATPNFLLALILILVGFLFFGQIPGGLFSPEYMDAPWSIGKMLNLFSRMWVPIIVIGTAGIAGTVRVMRGNLLDVLGQQYITTARAKGLKERVVTYKYGVRVAVNPLISGIGMSFPGIIGGEIIVAIVMGLPTAGPLLYVALMQQDMYLAGSFLLLLSCLLVLGNLVADIMLAWVDPRIKYQ